MTLVLALVLAALPGAVPTAEPLVPRPQREPEVHVVDLPVAPSPRGGGLTGRASWYEYVPGGAAAGPKLRALLGKGWRGSKVQVCADGDCVTVTLSDWCQCYKGEKRERIIDLDVRSFAALADPSAGLVRVTVHP